MAETLVVGYLTILEDVVLSELRNYDEVSTRCICGRERLVSVANIRKGTKSCGCRGSGHLKRKHPKECRIWYGMKRRCEDPNYTGYKDYGKRGIEVCERWQNLENFLQDMGPIPSPEYTLERVDVDGDYCLENCKWVTRFEQAQNRRTGHYLTVDGQKMSIAEAARRYNMHYTTIRERLLQNWTDEEAVKLKPIYGLQYGLRKKASI